MTRGHGMLVAALFVLAWLVPTHASANRWLRVRDESGARVDVRVIDRAGGGRRTTELCTNGCSEALTEVTVGDAGGRVLLQTRPRWDDDKAAIELRPARLGESCIAIAVAPAAAYFAAVPNSPKVCSSRPVDVVVQRRRLQLELRGLELAEQRTMEIDPAKTTPGVIATAAAYDPGTDRLRVTIELEEQGRALEQAAFALRPAGHHPVAVVVDLAAARRQSSALQVTVAAAVPVVRSIELVDPPQLEEEAEPAYPRVQYYVQHDGAVPKYFDRAVGETGPEWAGAVAAGRVHPCLVHGAHVSCPLLLDDGADRIFAADSRNAYRDRPSCTVRAGACSFTTTFVDPTYASEVRLDLDPKVAEVVRSGDPAYVLIDKTLPDGAKSSRTLSLVGNSVGVAEFVASDPPETRYDVRIYGGVLNHGSRRNALPVATRTRKDELVGKVHDARALRFQRLAVGPRGWAGFSWLAFNRRRNRAIDRRYGATATVGGAIRVEIHLRKRPITLFPEIGAEGTQLQTWTLDEDSAERETHWVARPYLGGGLRTRAIKNVPLSIELVAAWTPELARRGRPAGSGDMTVGLVGLHYGFGLLPRIADRLRAIVGVEAVFGSHTAIVTPTGPFGVRSQLRLTFGVSGTLSGLLPSTER